MDRKNVETQDSEDGVSEALRPVAKALVKAGVIAYDKLRETVVQANTQLSSMVNEARSGMRQTSAAENQGRERSTNRKAAKKKSGGGRKKR
jgi:hypothetical protein